MSFQVYLEVVYDCLQKDIEVLFNSFVSIFQSSTLPHLKLFSAYEFNFTFLGKTKCIILLFLYHLCSVYFYC